MKKRKKIDTKTLDHILENMIDTVGSSKDEIFRIGEECRQNYESFAEELKEIKIKVSQVIDDGDKLEVKTRFARKRLSEVSMHFKDFSEEEVRNAYEHAHRLQMELMVLRMREKELRERRDEIERQLAGLNETIVRAEHLVSQISVVMNYLTSDLKEMTQALEDAKQIHDFGLKIIEAQEEERKKLSREIHDGPAQMMANVMMRSDLIERIFKERGTAEAIKEIKNVKRMVRNALYEVRRIIYDLRPMALDDLGLVPTLKKYLHTIEDYHDKTKISFKNIGEERRLPPKYEVALFRLVQESVQNALKHANASEIKVKIEINKHGVTSIIRDDGVGFDKNQKNPNSFGLLGMRERVEILGGELSIDSKVGAGTVVLIQVPFTINK